MYEGGLLPRDVGLWIYEKLFRLRRREMRLEAVLSITAVSWVEREVVVWVECFG